MDDSLNPTAVITIIGILIMIDAKYCDSITKL